MKEKIKDILGKYLLPDCLKPQYDGMSMDEIAGIILEAVKKETQDEVMDYLEAKYGNKQD